MRVLYIHQFFATRRSPHPTRSYEFARNMVEWGHEVVMLTGDSRLEEECPTDSLRCSFEMDGIEVRAVRNRYSNYMGTARRIMSFLQFTLMSTLAAIEGPRPDVVFATSTPLTVGITGIIASLRWRVPLVFEVRDPWPEAAIQMGVLKRGGILGRTAKWLERTIYRRSTAVVGLSPGMTDCILAEGVPADKVHMIPNCSDLSLFHPGAKDAELTDRLGIGGQFVAVYAGALGPSYDIENLVEAAAILDARGRTDIAVVIVGEGRSRPAIEQQRSERNLKRLVISGSMPKDDMPALFRTADVVLVHLADVPILYTGSPNKLFDGLSSGRPIIVNSPGWTKALIEKNEVGLYVPPANPVALANAIEQLADDLDASQAMGERARALAEREFDRSDHARRLVAVLTDAMNGAR